MKRVAAVALLVACGLAGCASSQVVPAPGQATAVQNGRTAAMSRTAHSVVTVRAAKIINDPGGREQFLVEIQNTSDRPQTFSYEGLQLVNGNTGATMKVILPEEAKADFQAAAVVSAISLGGATAIAGAGVANVSTVGATAVAAGGGLATGLATADLWTTGSRITEVMLPNATIPPKATLSGMLLTQTILGDPKAYILTIAVGNETHTLAFTSG